MMYYYRIVGVQAHDEIKTIFIPSTSKQKQDLLSVLFKQE